MEYLSPQGVLLPLVYGTTASLLWLELRGHSAWQATPSWTVYRLACHRLLPSLRLTFAMVPDAAWPGSDQWPWSTAPAPGPVGRPGRPSASNPWGVCSFLSLGCPTCARCPGPLGSCSPLCPRGLLCCVWGVLGHLAPVHWCARSVCCVACAVSWAPWPPFTGVPAGCVVLCVRLPGPLGSCSPVHRSVCCFACAVSWATWLLFSGVPARCAVLCLRCPGPLGSCSPVRPLGVLCCMCGVLGHLAPVHQCARSVCCFACAMPWALGSCSPLCLLSLSFCLCGVLGHLAPVHRCARSVCCFVCAVSWTPWLLFTGVPGRGVSSLCCPSCMCVCGVLAQVAPVHRCARCVRCVCAVGGCVPPPPPLIFFFFSSSVFLF